MNKFLILIMSLFLVLGSITACDDDPASEPLSAEGKAAADAFMNIAFSQAFSNATLYKKIPGTQLYSIVPQTTLGCPTSTIASTAMGPAGGEVSIDGSYTISTDTYCTSPAFPVSMAFNFDFNFTEYAIGNGYIFGGTMKMDGDFSFQDTSTLAGTINFSGTINSSGSWTGSLNFNITMTMDLSTTGRSITVSGSVNGTTFNESYSF